MADNELRSPQTSTRPETPEASCQPMAVLYVHHAQMMGGAGESLRVLLRHLQPHAIQPLLLAPEDGLDVTNLPQRTEYHPVDPWDVSFSLNPVKLLLQAAKLRKLTAAVRSVASRRKPDIIHANTWPAAVAATMAISHHDDHDDNRPPVVWHVRDLKIRPMVTAWLNRCNPWRIAISKTVRRFLAERGFGHGRTFLVYNGIDPREFQPSTPPDEVRNEFEIPDDSAMVCSVAHPVPWKRHELLLHAAKLINSDRPDARFVFVGGYGSRHAARLRHLKRLARKLNLQDVVTFTGHRDGVADVVNAADVFWHAAAREPLGRVVMEAMSLKKPVVVTRSAGPAELVEHGVSGITVQPENERQMADAVLRLLNQPGTANAYGIAAGRRITAHFSAEQMAGDTLVAYHNITKDLTSGAHRH